MQQLTDFLLRNKIILHREDILEEHYMPVFFSNPQGIEYFINHLHVSENATHQEEEIFRLLLHKEAEELIDEGWQI